RFVLQMSDHVRHGGEPREASGSDQSEKIKKRNMLDVASTESTTGDKWKLVSDIAGLIVLGALAIWGMWRWLKRTEDPALLIFKWILSVIIIWIMYAKVGSMLWKGGLETIVGMHFEALCGLGLAAIWRRNISELFANRVGALYDGGSDEIEP